MKTFRIVSERGTSAFAPGVSPRSLAAWLAVVIGIGLSVASGRAQPPDGDAPGAQVLTRGPVHEAFAGVIAFNPEPGVVVSKAPPDVIEEVPPEERPEGDNVAWIPGYWAWDDERSDFLWISGTWRALPPGREWMAGYWGNTSRGHQWISGYWADTRIRVTSYLPPPPATVESGPNTAAPGIDYGWTPGSWIWFQGRYAWRPGYWAQGLAEWVWIPAHYVWTPRGYIFVDGFWDYPVERRGILFAPVFFEAGIYARRGYSYSPRIVINVALFSDQLFLRPLYHHYYFGDYYAASYVQGGYFASYSFQTGRYGYDPLYSRQRWVHRQDREWEHRVEVSFRDRRDNEAARPARTWVAQRSSDAAPVASAQSRMAIAVPIEQLAKGKVSAMRFQPVASPERKQLTLRREEVQSTRDQRRTLEAKADDGPAKKPGGGFEPARVQLPRSPIVGRPALQLGRNHMPPNAPQAPRPDFRMEPKSEVPVREINLPRGEAQPESRATGPERKSAPARGDAELRDRPARAEAEPRARGAAPKAPDAGPRNAKELPPPAKAAPAAEEPADDDKGPAKPDRKNPEKGGRGKPSP